MMLIVGVLCAIAAFLNYAIVVNFSPVNVGTNFLLSILVVFIAGGALSAKEHAVRKGAVRGRFFASFVPSLMIIIGIQHYLVAWKSVSGFWAKAVLVWIALLAVIVMWIPIQAAEEGQRPVV